MMGSVASAAGPQPPPGHDGILAAALPDPCSGRVHSGCTIGFRLTSVRSSAVQGDAPQDQADLGRVHSRPLRVL